MEDQNELQKLTEQLPKYGSDIGKHLSIKTNLGEKQLMTIASELGVSVGIVAERYRELTSRGVGSRKRIKKIVVDIHESKAFSIEEREKRKKKKIKYLRRINFRIK